MLNLEEDIFHWLRDQENSSSLQKAHNILEIDLSTKTCSEAFFRRHFYGSNYENFDAILISH